MDPCNLPPLNRSPICFEPIRTVVSILIVTIIILIVLWIFDFASWNSFYWTLVVVTTGFVAQKFGLFEATMKSTPSQYNENIRQVE